MSGIYKIGFWAFGVMILTSCLYEKEADLVVNCEGSTLSGEIQNVTPADCSDPGGFSVAGNGGEAPYLYSINGLDFFETEDFTGLSAGDYLVTIRDRVGCTSSISVTINASQGSILLMEVSKTEAGCESGSGSVTVNAQGGQGNVSYSVDEGDFQASPEFNGLTAGDHLFRARDEEGCETTLSINVLSGVSLEDEVMPIIDTNCAVSGCHNGSQFPRLTTKSEIIASASRVATRTSSGSMPPAGNPDLTDQEIALISCWVNDGALNN